MDKSFGTPCHGAILESQNRKQEPHNLLALALNFAYFLVSINTYPPNRSLRVGLLFVTLIKSGKCRALDKSRFLFIQSEIENLISASKNIKPPLFYRSAYFLILINFIDKFSH